MTKKTMKLFEHGVNFGVISTEVARPIQATLANDIIRLVLKNEDRIYRRGESIPTCSSLSINIQISLCDGLGPYGYDRFYVSMMFWHLKHLGIIFAADIDGGIFQKVCIRKKNLEEWTKAL